MTAPRPRTDAPSRAPMGRRTVAALAAAALLGAAAPAIAAPAISSAQPGPAEWPAIGADAANGSSASSQGEVTAPPNVAPAGTIRADFGAPGPYEVGFTRDVRPCDDLVYTLYVDILEGMNGVQSPPQCHGAFPNGTDSPIGVQYYWPTGTADAPAPGRAPLLVLSPGIGTEPGMMHRQAVHYASHGYVVALGYSLVNWFGYQLELAAQGAVDQANDPESPLYGRIDFGNVVLAGHSAGGGSAIRMGSTLDAALSRHGGVAFTTRGIAAMMPGPSDFGHASPAPNAPMLIAVAERESLVPHPLSRIAWDRHAGPAWWTVVQGTYHGSYLDEPSYNAFGALVLSFADHVTGRDAAATAVYAGDTPRLATDPELTGTEIK